MSFFTALIREHVDIQEKLAASGKQSQIHVIFSYFDSNASVYRRNHALKYHLTVQRELPLADSRGGAPGARPPPPPPLKSPKQSFFNAIFCSRYCFLLLIFFNIKESDFFLARSARKRRYLNLKLPNRRRPAKIPSFTAHHIFWFHFLNDDYWSPLLCVNAHINCQYYHTDKHCGAGSEQSDLGPQCLQQGL